MKKLAFILLFFITFFISCSSESSKEENNSKINNSSDKSVSENLNENNASKDTAKNENNSTNNSSAANAESNDKDKNISEINNQNVTEKITDYIINGQENKPEAEKLKWSESFLNRIDIGSLYDQYISSGGNPNDLESISQYVTLNAPILNDWKKLFERDLYNIYGQKVTKLEPLDNDLYQAYVNIDGKDVPYVVVSARTGYFHG